MIPREVDMVEGGMEFRASLVKKSTNRKTGPMPVSQTERASCPSGCPFRDNGCYAEMGPIFFTWRSLSEGRRGGMWSAFLGQVRKLTRGVLWRHNAAGDLPHRDGSLLAEPIRGLVEAQRGCRGFTYTHHDILKGSNLELIREANAEGFTVNVSVESGRAADAAMDLGLPVVQAVIPETPRRSETPAGRPVLQCPATYSEKVTCTTCGWCAIAERKFVVAFPVHGSRWKTASDAIMAGLQLPLLFQPPTLESAEDEEQG